MEAVKEGQDTSQHGPQRVDVMAQISSVITDDCLTNNMSVIEPALALLEMRGVQALNGPTLYVEYWDTTEEGDEVVEGAEYFEYKGEPRYNQLSSITRFEKILCALLHATTQHLGHTVVPFCVVSNLWAVCRGDESVDGYEEMLSTLANLVYNEHRGLIRLAKAGDGPNTIAFQPRLGLNRNKLTSVMIYLLCTSYAPNDEALDLYTNTNWKGERRRNAYNRLWRVMNSTKPATKLFDGANVTEILPSGRVRGRICNEGALPEHPNEDEEQGEQPVEPVHANEDDLSEPDNIQSEEVRFIGIYDPSDKGPTGPNYVAPTRNLPKIIHKKCRVYCDLPAEAICCDSNRDPRSAKVGGRMTATLTDSECAKLPGIVLGAPMATNDVHLPRQRTPVPS
ncbi:unnamed protein product [Haemonchus placei]|uniref:Similar to n=1 Tax=Haemonchus placei TaxID=6290 RepID=A0A0N4WMJ9_HAEPC|nr:unnamed protein product [Haemonchus placei]